MMNKTHADIHQVVSKPVGISQVNAITHRYGLSDMIIHFKKSMGGVDRLYQNVGKCIMQDWIKKLVVVPAAVLP